MTKTPSNKRLALRAIAAGTVALCGALAASGALAQSTIKIANIVELSGGGATAGTNFKNGVELAVKEINAAGGILGKKIETTTADTQSNPGVAKGLTQKAVDNDVFAIFGPVFSGSIMVSMAEISTEAGQLDFSAAVLRAKQSNADAVFVYTYDEESARALRELRKQGWSKPIVGEGTLTAQKVLELAGDAANGAIAHVNLTVDAPLPAVQAFRVKFEREYKYVSDHNGMKGYSGMYVLKTAIERVGKLDRQAVAAALHGMKITVAQQPGVLMDLAFDDKGDLDRDSFMVEVKNGKQVVIATVPALGAAKK